MNSPLHKRRLGCRRGETPIRPSPKSLLVKFSVAIFVRLEARTMIPVGYFLGVTVSGCRAN